MSLKLLEPLSLPLQGALELEGWEVERVWRVERVGRTWVSVRA